MRASRKIFLFGADEPYATEAIEICEINGYKHIVCVIDNHTDNRKQLDNYPVVSSKTISAFKKNTKFICCSRIPIVRIERVKKAQSLHLAAVSLVHPSAIISKRADISEHGILIGALVAVGSHTKINEYVLINRGALIGHHVSIDKYVTIESGVCMNSLTTIGRKTYVGAGAIILPNITIGTNCVVAAGAVVRESVPDNCMVAGVPARIKKKNIKYYFGLSVALNSKTKRGS